MYIDMYVYKYIYLPQSLRLQGPKLSWAQVGDERFRLVVEASTGRLPTAKDGALDPLSLPAKYSNVEPSLYTYIYIHLRS